jgi:hypothetical protein
MGKGIALEFRRRYPEMFEEYKQVCDNNGLSPGQVWYYGKSDKIILNFAIKSHWKFPSEIEWLEQSLTEFYEKYKTWNIKSAAFPWMGAMNGELPFEQIKTVMLNHLNNIEINVEIYDFDPGMPDPWFLKLKELANMNEREFNVQKKQLKALNDAQKKQNKEFYIMGGILDKIIQEIRNNEKITSMYLLEKSQVVGSKNVENLFRYLSYLIKESKKFKKNIRLDSFE